METIIGLVAEILRLLPLILAFYIPALLGVAILRERGEAYRVKAGVWFAVGFGAILLVRLVLRSTSTLQVAATIGVSLVEIAAALALAYFTVYKLAD